jgi:hypothetical protein
MSDYKIHMANLEAVYSRESLPAYTRDATWEIPTEMEKTSLTLGRESQALSSSSLRTLIWEP